MLNVARNKITNYALLYNNMKDTIGERLSNLILALKLTPNAFAGKIGVKTSIIYNIIKAKNKPSFDLLSKISDEFNVSVDWLVKGVGDNAEGYLKSVNENYAKKDNKKGNNLDNQNSESVGGNRHNEHELSLDEVKRLGRNNILREVNIAKAGDSSGYFSNDPVGVKIQRLRDLEATYSKRIKRDMHSNNEKLYSVMQLLENTDAIISLLSDININTLNNPPDPFEVSQYLDLKTNTEHIPDTIDYKDYKNLVVAWLQKIEKYKASINRFYDCADSFLKEIKELDEHDLY